MHSTTLLRPALRAASQASSRGSDRSEPRAGASFPLRTCLSACLLLVAGVLPLSAQDGLRLDEAWVDGFRWRSIGPANMAGRVTDIEGLPSPSKTFYFAAASGGIWKTTNNGTTYRPLFTDERVASMGDLAIAPSDSMQIWAGTGEEDSRNSISPGGGVYKSADGGLSWELMGLEGTEHIGRIVVHPDDPDVVWVAAVGPLWRTGGERGLYKTTDGGESWRRVHFVSDRAGFVDVAIHPDDPDVLLASSWERLRGPYFFESGGPGSALWRSEDGGESWTEVTGGGFPETELGRIGIGWAPSDPDIIYTMVEAAPEEEGGDRLSGLYRSTDGGATWERRDDFNTRPFYYSEVRVDPLDPDRVYFSSFRFSTDGGETSRAAAREVHVDFHAFWIDPFDPDRLVVGNDGGIAISYDRGGNYHFPNILPLGQFYNISVGMDVPYTVCGGLQDNYSWCGPSRKDGGAITNHDWFRVSGGDGFVTQQDPRDPDIVYSESQRGNMGRSNLATGERESLGRPDWRERYRLYQDSIALLWPDSTRPMPEENRAEIERLQQRASADSAALQLRYNWNTPFFLSPHDPDVVYAGANRVLKSTNRGDDLVPISPDLSRQDAEKIEISTETTGGITPDVTGAEVFATITSVAESPLEPGVLWAGTDDGNLWTSPDDGESWVDVTAATADLVPDGTYVSRIEPSSHVGDRVYVTFDNHRRGDFTPYVLVTEDAGASFRSISSDLPTGKPDFVYVIREDPVNENLLFVGTDVGVYLSLDRGGSWQRFMHGFPTVPVRDLKIHPRDGDLVAGTHGRSIWITHIGPLQQMDAAVMASDAYLFEPRPAYHFGTRPTGGEFTAQHYFEAENPGEDAEIMLWLAEPQDDVVVEVLDPAGRLFRRGSGPDDAGLHTLTWDLRGEGRSIPRSPAERRDSLAIEHRIATVTDSLVQAGESREAVEEVVGELRDSGGGGGFGGGFGGGGGGVEEFEERPAEGPPPRARDQEEEEEEEEEEPTLEETVRRLVLSGSGGFRGRFGRFGGLFPQRTESSPLAEPGTYTIIVRIGDRTLSQPLRVEQDSRR